MSKRIKIIFQSMQMAFDQKCRKQRFAKILLSGIKSEMLGAMGYVKAHIEQQKEELQIERAHWRERLDRIDEKYKELNDYGYENREEFFNSSEDDPNLEALNVIDEINRMSITSEAQENHLKIIDEHLEEIEASEGVLSSLEKMSPIISGLSVSSVEEIENLFKENDCSYLLNMPNIINVNRILDEYYFQ